MPTYGRRTLGSTGVAIQVSADGSPEWKAGGVTIDWATVTAEAGRPRRLAQATARSVFFDMMSSSALRRLRPRPVTLTSTVWPGDARCEKKEN